MTPLPLAPWLAWLIVALAAAAAAAVFVMRPRPRSAEVSSLVVWARVLDQAPERSWWERVRWIVSLALTVLIATALAAAFARPAPGAAAGSSGRLLLVLDSSWSMRARTASGATRWELAVRAARATAEASGANEMALATTAEGVVERPTADLTLVRRALDRLTPSGGVEGGFPRLTDAGAVHFFTDGARQRATPPEVVIHSVFAPAPNVAVTAFDVQPAATMARRSPGPGAEIFLSVANYSLRPQTVSVGISRGTEVIFDRAVAMEAGETHHETVAVAPTGDPRFRAHVSAPENHLDLDDDATTWLWTAQPLEVAVVGGSGRLPALLARDAGLRVVTVQPAGYAQAKADVWVFDGWLPAGPPAQPALVVDAPASDWLGPSAAEETQPVWAAGGSHAVLDGIDPALVQVGHARPIARAGLKAIASSERGTPLVSVEDSRAGRYVVLGFSIADSNLASTPALPILIGNAIDWLGRRSRDLQRHPGPIVLPAGTVHVVAPDGRSIPLTMHDDRVTARLVAPGLYLVQSSEGQRVLRVTLGDTALSNLLVSHVAEDQLVPSAAPVAPRRPWWAYAALAGLLFAALEWVTWQRRITV